MLQVIYQNKSVSFTDVYATINGAIGNFSAHGCFTQKLFCTLMNGQENRFFIKSITGG
jgi:hypothetical protein